MDKVAMQFFDEPDTNGDRKMIAPITTTDEVIVNPGSPNSKTLTEQLNDMHPIMVGKVKPTFPCLWAKVIK